MVQPVVPHHLDAVQAMQYFTELLTYFFATQKVLLLAEGWTWKLVYVDNNPVTGTPSVVIVFISPDARFGYVANCCISELVEGGKERHFVFENIEEEGDRFLKVIVPIMVGLTAMPSTELALKSIVAVTFAPNAEALPLLGIDFYDLGRELGEAGLI